MQVAYPPEFILPLVVGLLPLQVHLAEAFPTPRVPVPTRILPGLDIYLHCRIQSMGRNLQRLTQGRQTPSVQLLTGLIRLLNFLLIMLLYLLNTRSTRSTHGHSHSQHLCLMHRRRLQMTIFPLPVPLKHIPVAPKPPQKRRLS